MPDNDQLLAMWDTYAKRSIWHEVSLRGDQAVATDVLDKLPEVSALDALAANRDLVNLLIGRRWSVMRDAREAGASWSAIGAALGMSKQGAQDWYRRKIAEQEQQIADLHDTERAQRAL